MQVHIYYACPETRSEEERAADWALLESDERDRASRFVFEVDRRTYAVAHALVRRALSRHSPVAPADWRYKLGSHGRPEIAGPEGAGRLRFNLSHTRGLTVCAIVKDCDIGVDVEDAHRHAPLEVADSYFAPLEVQALKTLPASQQPERFFVYWTLKEAYIKARGMGLALPLDQFAFRLDTEGPISIAISKSLRDDPASWRFLSWRSGERHQLALAVRTNEELALEHVYL